MIDNFDSFTYLLTDYLLRTGVTCKVLRNNLALSDYQTERYDGIVLSPGPSRPQDANQLMNILEIYANCLPILGVCLGHQALGLYFGATLCKARRPMHGKISKITCEPNSTLFRNLPTEIKVVRYHSLILQNLPPTLIPTAWTDEGELMAFEHAHLPICGIQFHPEAALTEFGLEMLLNWTCSLK
ncbi:MAG: aminodeoxychorismate/anthranilate synthase component II [Cytophagales bacterium]|nr:aminodeoxychorismate/anthranilate synthase component II [Cytophagales bacterium]MDW8384831.1 aminodeoxychorismate/anthranilate synthase component II [Flammeovirgaceae bacterium]